MNRLGIGIWIVATACLADRASGWQQPYSVTGSAQLVPGLQGKPGVGPPVIAHRPSATGSWQLLPNGGIQAPGRWNPTQPPVRIIVPMRASPAPVYDPSTAPWNQRIGSPSVTGSGVLSGAPAVAPPSIFQAALGSTSPREKAPCDSCFKYLGASPTGAWYGRWPYCTLAPGGAVWPFFTYNLALAGAQYAALQTQPPLIPVAAPTAAYQPPSSKELETPAKPPSDASLPSPREFVAAGDKAFRAGDYVGAVRAWRHAVVDDPGNGQLVLLLAQALFAVGQYDESAGAVQQAMRMLPPGRWGEVVSTHKRRYGKVQDYTDQLRALEAARNKSPKAPEIRFLLGYQYGYLGFHSQAIAELDKTLALAPNDEWARKLKEAFEKAAKRRAE